MSGFLRVAGCIVAPVLAATGVGLPLAIGIGAVAAGGANLGADAIDRNAAENRANEEAERQRQAAREALERQRAEEQARAREVQRQLEQQQAQAALPGRILNACRQGTLSEVSRLLPRLTNEQFTALGLNPIAVCRSAADQTTVTQILDAERTRRGLN